jgi:hypothetical protein
MNIYRYRFPFVRWIIVIMVPITIVASIAAYVIPYQLLKNTCSTIQLQYKAEQIIPNKRPKYREPNEQPTPEGKEYPFKSSPVIQAKQSTIYTEYAPDTAKMLIPLIPLPSTCSS